MDNLEPPTGNKSRFIWLAEQFDEIARHVDEIEKLQPAEDSKIHPWTSEEDGLLNRHARLKLNRRYRHLVRTAGESLLSVAEEGSTIVKGLPELIAIRELNEWGGLLEHPENLFALLVNGPRVELWVHNSDVREEYEISHGPIVQVPRPSSELQKQSTEQTRRKMTPSPWEATYPDRKDA